MKKLMILLAICMVITMIPLSVAGDGDVISEPWDYVAGVDYVDGEVIILTDYYVNPSVYSGEGSFTFHGVEMTELNPLFSASTEEEIEDYTEKSGSIFSYVAILASSVSVQSAVNTLSDVNGILVAEPNFIIEQEPVSEEADVGDADVESWVYDYLEMETVRGYGFAGSSDVVVAVLDTGNVPHTDLQSNIVWEAAYDATDRTYDATPEYDYSNHDHATVITGIIGADNDDDFMSGICSSVSILPIKVFANGYTNAGHVLNGIEHAIEYGVDIINLSITMRSSYEAVRIKISGTDILCVSSAGNSSLDMATASDSVGKRHNEPNWLFVGAMNENETKSYFSNYSPIYCDMFAPGSILTSLAYSYDDEGNLVSELATGQNGTSFAAPHVAAACALIMSHATHLTPLEVKELLMDTVKPLNGFDDYCVSGGTLSITNAIEYLYTCNRGAYTKGDVNGDGYVTMADYDMARNAFFGQVTLTDAQFDAANVYEDEQINMVDCMKIKTFVLMQHYFIP